MQQYQDGSSILTYLYFRFMAAIIFRIVYFMNFSVSPLLSEYYKRDFQYVGRRFVWAIATIKIRSSVE